MRLIFFSIIFCSISCSTLKKTKSIYEAQLTKGMDRDFPGFILGVKKGNEKEWIGAKGLASIEKETLINKHDRFHIASITKLFTSVAILKLIDQKKLKLNSNISEFLSNSLIGEIPFYDQIKIHHLLDHSSGIYSFNNDLDYLHTLLGEKVEENILWSNEELIALTYKSRVEPQGMPGSGHFYSDANTIFLSLIIEKVTGTAFRSYIKEHIIDELNLKNTGFYDQSGNEDGLDLAPTVQGYLKKSDILNGFIKLSPVFKEAAAGLLNTSRAGERIDASAGIVSCASDLIKLGSAIYQDDFISPESLNFLLSIGNGIEKEATGTTRQGIVTVRNKSYGVLYTSLGDGGGGINSMLAYYPKDDLIIVAFTNIFGNFDEHDFFIDEIVPAIILSKE